MSAVVSGIIRDKSAKVCSASNAEHSSEQRTAKRMKIRTQTCFFGYENIKKIKGGQKRIVHAFEYLIIEIVARNILK